MLVGVVGAFVPSTPLCLGFPFKHSRPRCAQGLPRPLPLRTSATCTLSEAQSAAAKPSIVLDAESFISDSWGVSPTLLRALVPNYESPLTADDLAGLACEEDVESRIITGRGAATGVAGEEPYTLSLGPFQEATFQSPLCADERPWTLLVQEVNRHVPLVADLLDCFRFLPNWRVDDVMISYANTGGGVGPHTDNYDVFLLQVAGHRRWRTSSVPISAAEERDCLAPDLDVRILRGGFRADQDVELGPGDCMYVPPRCPHWGEALDSDCITFSIGFRVPTVADLASGWVDEALRRAGLHDAFLVDSSADLVACAAEPGLVSKVASDAAYDAVLEALQDRPESRSEFRAWFAEQVSASKRFREAPGPDEMMSSAEAAETVKGLLNGCDSGSEWSEVRQQEGSVFAYADLGRHAEQVSLYVDGETISDACDVRLASLICSRRATAATAYAKLGQGLDNRASRGEMVSLLSALFARGLLYMSDPALAIDEDNDWQ